jgi:hypothetical protein
MRIPLALAALAGGSLALPARAHAQAFAFQQIERYGNVSNVSVFGILRVGATSPTGCGIYACLRVLLGRADSAPGSSPTFGLEARVTSLQFTPAFDALGAASFEYAGPGATFRRSTSFTGGFQRDSVGADLPLTGNSLAPLGAARGLTVSPAAFGGLSTTVELFVSTSGVFEFRAFAADGRLLARESIVANVTVAPEPATLALAGASVLLLGAWARRNRGA